MIDVAADLEAAFGGGDFTPLSGALLQDGTSTAFTKAIRATQSIRLGGNGRDSETMRITVLASDLPTVRRDSTIVFTGEDGSLPWIVGTVQPINAPGGSAAAHQVDLSREVPALGQQE